MPGAGFSIPERGDLLQIRKSGVRIDYPRSPFSDPGVSRAAVYYSSTLASYFEQAKAAVHPWRQTVPAFSVFLVLTGLLEHRLN